MTGKFTRESTSHACSQSFLRDVRLECQRASSFASYPPAFAREAHLWLRARACSFFREGKLFAVAFRHRKQSTSCVDGKALDSYERAAETSGSMGKRGIRTEVHETSMVLLAVRVEPVTMRWEYLSISLIDAVGTMPTRVKFYFQMAWQILLTMPNPHEPAISHRAMFCLQLRESTNFTVCHPPRVAAW